MSKPFDAIVIGTGFAGAVTACRLSQAAGGRPDQAKFRICVLERGRRYGPNDFPTYPARSFNRAGTAAGSTLSPPPDFTRWLWKHAHGLWELRNLDDVIVAQAAGYGGGSLIYASVHLRAPNAVFTTIAGWPATYTRGVLDPYYDLVAYMLDVKPVPDDLNLAKMSRMSDAADALGANWFRTPLAVNFGAPRTRWKRKQGKCDLRGFCTLGCGAQAKNTLDLNYLAIAEDNGADVRTLAEVTEIGAMDGPDGAGYQVTYLDHLEGQKKVSLQAKYVFLCAGAVNTTELLLRNRARLKRLKTKDGPLGSAYHPNADSLAVVFDCDRVHDADRGPTITSSLLYNKDNLWFLIQEGGFPDDLEPLVGAFRSPLWLRRNRYLESDDPTGPPAMTAIAPGNLQQPSAALASRRVSELPAYLPLDMLRETLSRIPPDAMPAETLLRSVFRLRGAQQQPEPGDDQILPPWLKTALEKDRDEIFSRLSAAAEPIVAALLDELAGNVETRLPSRIVNDYGDQIREFNLIRGGLTLGAQLLWGSEADVARGTAELLRRRVPGKPDEWIELASALLGWMFNYREGNGRTAMLLAMGRDLQAGRISLSMDVNSRLSVELPAEPEPSMHLAQERIMRDIAGSWGGELRTNPAWTLAGSRMSVHSQGGCPMADDPGGVTQANGEVNGCQGLYVMDAAAFPAAVGVNPSATIAAIAEYKIERFIRSANGDPTWSAPQWDVAQAWMNEGTRRATLDPIGEIDMPASAPPISAPVGLMFNESMTGFHAPSEAAVPPDDWPALTSTMLRTFETADLSGLRTGGKIRVDLVATIDNLVRFLEEPPAGEPVLTLTGQIVIEGLPGQEQTNFEVGPESCLRLFVDAGTPGPRRTSLLYELHFTSEGGQAYVIRGAKLLRDDFGFDVLQDTRTLFFDLLETPPTGTEPVRRGILRLSLEDFLGQTRSFEVTGTSDTARQSWALAAFLKFFVGNLASVYAPGLGGSVDVLKRILGRTHG